MVSKMSKGTKNDWDDEAAREQGNAGEDTADSAGRDKGKDRNK